MRPIVHQLFTIRNWKSGDEQGLREMLNNKSIIKNLSDEYHYPFSDADAERYIRSYQDPSSTNFAVTSDGNIGNIIGGIELIFKEDPRVALIEGWLGESYWNKGTGREMFKILSIYALDNYSIEQVEARVYLWNMASARMLEAAGFLFNGVKSKGSMKGGVPVDIVSYIFRRNQDTQNGRDSPRMYQYKFGQKTL